jgi:hypothetical protein
MRILTLTSVVALLAASPAALAQGRTAPDAQLPRKEASTPYASKESATLAEEAREKSEALERARDKRMKSLTRGICSGC